jgi:hypothetical protein
MHHDYECLIRSSLCYFIYRTIAPIEKFAMKNYAEATYNSLSATSYLTASIFDLVDLISYINLFVGLYFSKSSGNKLHSFRAFLLSNRSTMDGNCEFVLSRFLPVVLLFCLCLHFHPFNEYLIRFQNVFHPFNVHIINTQTNIAFYF